VLFRSDGTPPPAPAITVPDEAPTRLLWVVPSDAPVGHAGKHFVDFQNDVTAADVRLAAREGYRSVEHLKRYTTTGMGTDQGKTSNMHALAILSEAVGAEIASVGTTTFRPPYTPVPYGTLAGREVFDAWDPLRKTAIDAEHVAAGAAFENVGQWRRPWYYPRAGETMHDAVQREILATRRAVGIFDASTLGKIDVSGPDAATLLDWMYCNSFGKLAVGRCRYGLMLKEDGMVMDDGVTARLADHRFHMTTTTGNAARVLSWMEEWLQTEWPHLKVHLTSVTEQWAVVALNGPRARDVLAAIGTDIALDDEAFPFMTVRTGRVAGMPARVFRVSFTGEDVAFEINVPARHGAALWRAAMAAGAAHGITPYGTEAMHVLRAEAGFVIVGQETDGTVTPDDLGLGRMVAKGKDFLGKRSLARPDTRRADRKQLVGLLTENPKDVLPEGAQIVADLKNAPPMTMVGHVTSSYMSANCGRSIAMALIKDGRRRQGETLYAPLLDGRVLRVKLVEPRFLGADGKWLHG
jgi:sarcosine oxidase subunit alpha